MLTHEKVLKVFGPYLDADPDYEVVKTSRGYTLLAWNNLREEWFSAEFCNPGFLHRPAEHPRRCGGPAGCPVRCLCELPGICCHR